MTTGASGFFGRLDGDMSAIWGQAVLLAQNSQVTLPEELPEAPSAGASCRRSGRSRSHT